MAIKSNREYRNFNFEIRAGDADAPEYRVEGYASTFKPYVLYNDGEHEYKEQVDPHAFDGADMSDVIFLYDHEGMVYARQKNGTLDVSVDDRGLKVSADLSKTEAARAMFENIRSGMVDQMSFAFTVDEDEYDKKSYTRTIKRIGKVYDVSAVSIPANPDTDISAVSAHGYFNGVIEAGKAERLERAKTPRKPSEIKISNRGGHKPMTYNEINYLNKDGILAKLDETAARKAELSTQEVTDENNAEMRGLDSVAEMLKARMAELDAIETRKADAAAVAHGAGAIKEDSVANPIEERAKKLLETGKMELRALLSTGVLTPTAVKQEIGELPTVMSSIVDDVHSFSLDAQAGAWAFAYRNKDSVAKKVETEGDKLPGEAGTFDKGEIQPETWAILDEISNQVKHFTPLAYEQSVRNNAYLALRRYAKHKITETIVTDATMVDKTTVTAIDENFLRNLVLGFNSDEGVAGGAKLYLTKATLAKLGAIRGASEKRALYDITFTDENNGAIKEGGMSVNFSILADLGDTSIDGIEEGKDVLIYGQMQTVDMPLWGNYTIETDEGGGYFARNMMGIRGVQSAGVGVTRQHTVQVITVSADP